jgi:neutral ceramidase
LVASLFPVSLFLALSHWISDSLVEAGMSFSAGLLRKPCVGPTFLLLLFLLPVTKSKADPSRGWTAGAAVRDVTPEKPVPMWGYGSRHAQLSEGTLDPLQATAMVIAIEGRKLAIVGLDLGRSPSEASLGRIREAIATRAGIEHSIIAGSHTHHGPVVELSDRAGRGKGRFDDAIAYVAMMEDRIIEAIVEADANRVEASLEYGATELTGYNRNRHSKIPPIPLDRSLQVLRFQDISTGKTIGTLVNFAAHPTSIPEDRHLFSSDFVGAMRKEIEATLGGQAIFLQGASGDCSTDRSGHGDHVAFGKALGRQVVQLAGNLTPSQPRRANLEVREERFQFASRTNFRNPVVIGAYSIAFFPELVATFVDEYQEGIRPRLTVALINQEIALVAGSGEFFCQHAISLRERARVKQLIFCGYANGYHQYFPTIEAAAEGGYGADTTVAPAEVGAGETMMNTALLWLYQMRKKL